MRLVCIGGGNGLSNLLKGLVTESDFDITAIVSVMDSGGSTGKIRQRYNTIAFGDIRRALEALATNKSLKRQFNTRYTSGENLGHTFGNLYLLDLYQKLGFEEVAIKQAAIDLKIRGQVLPVTTDKVELEAELENGQEIFREHNIDVPKHDGNLRIKNICLKPQAKINPEALEEIAKADIILMGPGDLYTSVLCNFLVTGIRQSIKASRATKVWINNLTNEFGETTNFTLDDYLSQIDQYIGLEAIDYVLYQTKQIGQDSIDCQSLTYDQQQTELIGADFALLKNDEYIHDVKKIIKIIRQKI